MEVVIQGHDLKITDTLEQYTRKKIEKLNRYLPNIRDVRIELSHQNSKGGGEGVAQITIRHERGAILRVQERKLGEVENAINSAVDNMYRQIQRFKSKRSHKGKERFYATVDEINQAEAVPYEDTITQEMAPVLNLGVARRKEISLSPMTEADAIEQMELLSHGFFMFLNAETNTINVLYKRAGGDYGLLIPDIK